MRTSHRKDVLTTGQVATVCHVAPRTVSKWFDSGKLKGYRIPGSRDRRIPIDQLIAFMRAHGLPLDGLDGGTCRVLIVGEQLPGELLEALSAADRYEVRTAANGFEAGVFAQQFRPHVVVLPVDEDADGAAGICRNIKGSASLGAAKVIASANQITESLRSRLLSKGFDEVLPSPYTFPQLARTIENATDLLR